MIAEVEEKDVFEAADFDELAELKALTRSIKRADGFSLLFARCNQRPKQIELQGKVIAEIPEKNVRVIYFEKAIENLVDELRDGLNGEQPDAVFVYGLESSMPKADEAYKTPFVLNLNASRNSFPTVADCPVVFWLPDYGIRAIMNGAPDFFSVRSGIFFFENDEEILSTEVSQAVSIGYRQHDALLLEERAQRLTNLKELLAQYQSLPDNKRDLETEYKLKDKLANIYYKTANFSESAKITKKLLEDIREIDERKYSNQLNNLALVYKSQGKYDEAIDLYKQALLIDEKTVGKEHSIYATRLNNLALVYKTQGRYEEAIELYKQALLIAEKTVGKKHPNYATRLSNLASVYGAQNRYDEAIDLYEQALEIGKKTVGKKHPHYANRLSNLASVYRSQGKYDEAIDLYKQALEIGEKTIGKEHPIYATRLNNLALVYRSQGRYEEAIDLYKQALLITEKTVGKEHPDYANRLNNLANVYSSQGKYDEALSMFEEALRLCLKFFGENHPHTQLVKENLESCREAVKNKP